MAGLPVVLAEPLLVDMMPDLTAWRGRLFSGQLTRGTAIHAASFVRRRAIVLETGLMRRSADLRLILVHEIFHFVWPRLGNPLRASYTEILRRERGAGARGELGESAQVQKDQLSPAREGLRFRNYVCESFCDTAAWLYGGVRAHPAFTLRPRWSEKRRQWFAEAFASARTC